MALSMPAGGGQDQGRGGRGSSGGGGGAFCERARHRRMQKKSKRGASERWRTRFGSPSFFQPPCPSFLFLPGGDQHPPRLTLDLCFPNWRSSSSGELGTDSPSRSAPLLPRSAPLGLSALSRTSAFVTAFCPTRPDEPVHSSDTKSTHPASPHPPAHVAPALSSLAQGLSLAGFGSLPPSSVQQRSACTTTDWVDMNTAVL